MRTFLRATLICGLVLFITGCTRHYSGFRPQPIDIDYLPRVQISDDVNVIGVYSREPKDVLFSDVKLKCYADHNELVDIAVAAAKDILEQNSIVVNKDARKTLKISFVDAHEGECGAFLCNQFMRFRVQAGDEVTKEFEGFQNVGSDFQIKWAIVKATSHAMIQVFEDPLVLHYLSN